MGRPAPRRPVIERASVAAILAVMAIGAALAALGVSRFAGVWLGS